VGGPRRGLDRGRARVRAVAACPAPLARAGAAVGLHRGVRSMGGGTVRWINDDATYHTVTSTDSLDRRVPNGRFNAILDTAGATFTYTFVRPGGVPPLPPTARRVHGRRRTRALIFLQEPVMNRTGLLHP